MNEKSDNLLYFCNLQLMTLNNISLYYVSKYFNSVADYINLTKTCKLAENITTNYLINPLPISIEQIFVFENLNTIAVDEFENNDFDEFMKYYKIVLKHMDRKFDLNINVIDRNDDEDDDEEDESDRNDDEENDEEDDKGENIKNIKNIKNEIISKYSNYFSNIYINKLYTYSQWLKHGHKYELINNIIEIDQYAIKNSQMKFMILSEILNV